MARLRLHLSPAEVAVLYELSVYTGAAPRDAWRSNQKVLRTLADLGAGGDANPGDRQPSPGNQNLALSRNCRSTVGRSTHLAAATHHADRSRFTQAAHHYIQAGRSEMALWTWYNHRQQEIEQGQAGAALEMFTPLTQTALPNLEDQRVLALLIAQLCSPAGRTQEGLAASGWRPLAPSHTRQRTGTPSARRTAHGCWRDRAGAGRIPAQSGERAQPALDPGDQLCGPISGGGRFGTFTICRKRGTR